LKKPAWGPDLVRILRGKYGAGSAVETDEIEKAIASTVEVLILVLPEQAPPLLSNKHLDALRNRKVIGIGKGAVELFDQMGLAIETTLCGDAADSRITVTKSDLFNNQKSVSKTPTISATDKRAADVRNQGEMEIQVQAAATSAPIPPGRLPTEIRISIPDPSSVTAADISRIVLASLQREPGSAQMFIPTGSPYSSVVDAIARSAENPVYAPIVRQGNCVMVGLTIPPARWSQPYTELFCQLCQNLLELKREPLSALRWPVTPAGKYEFKLAEASQADKAAAKWFFFELNAPTTITAHLSFRGSKVTTMWFAGKDRVQWRSSRGNNDGAAIQQPRHEQEISETIDQKEIEQMKGRYWKLVIANGDDDAVADCTLSIQFALPKK
jgi:hypothetical protein